MILVHNKIVKICSNIIVEKIHCNENMLNEKNSNAAVILFSNQYTFTCFTYYIQMVLLRSRDGNLSILLFYLGAKSSYRPILFLDFSLISHMPHKERLQKNNV